MLSDKILHLLMWPTLGTLAIGTRFVGGLLSAAAAAALDCWNLCLSWETFNLESKMGLACGFNFSRAQLSSSDFLRILIVLVKSESIMGSPFAGSSKAGWPLNVSTFSLLVLAICSSLVLANVSSNVSCAPMLPLEHSLYPESLRSLHCDLSRSLRTPVPALRFSTCGISTLKSSSSSFREAICVLFPWAAPSILRPEIEGRGLLLAPMAIAELRREADSVAMRPKARIALPVFLRVSAKQTALAAAEAGKALNRL